MSPRASSERVFSQGVDLILKGTATTEVPPPVIYLLLDLHSFPTSPDKAQTPQNDTPGSQSPSISQNWHGK